MQFKLLQEAKGRRGDLQGRPLPTAKRDGSLLAWPSRPVAARLAAGDPEGRPYGLIDYPEGRPYGIQALFAKNEQHPELSNIYR